MRVSATLIFLAMVSASCLPGAEVKGERNARGGYIVDLKGKSAKPSTPMVATPIAKKLFVVIDEAKIADTYTVTGYPEQVTPPDVKGFRPVLKDSLRDTLSPFFSQIAFVTPGFTAPAEPHFIADVKTDRITANKQVIGIMVHMILEMNWAFALRASGDADYLFSISGVAKSEQAYNSLDIGCQQVLTSAMNGLLKGWTDKAVYARLSGKQETPEATPKQAAAKMVLAVFDVRDASKKIDQDTLIQTTNFLGALLTTTGKFSVVPRDQLRARLMDEKKGSYRACVDEGCQIELGKAMAAEKTLSTTLIMVGGKCAVTSSLFDLKTETAQQGATVETGCKPEELLGAMKKIVEQLTAAGG